MKGMKGLLIKGEEGLNMKRRGIFHRIGFYAFLTLIVTVVWLLIRLSYGYSVPPQWIFYFIYNIGMLLNPMEGGPLLPALITGITFIFLIISASGETIKYLKERIRRRVLNE